MKIQKLFNAFFIFLTLIFSGNAFASGLTAYEQGQPGIGTANVGQAVEEDASSSYFNPAVMADLERSEIMSGSHVLFLHSKYYSQQGSLPQPTGGDGGEAGMVVPGGGFYGVYKFHPKMAVGLAVNGPAGSGIGYDDSWKGRYLIQNSFMAVANINPSLSVKLADWISVGAGLSVYYGIFREEIAILNPPSIDLFPLDVSPNPDGQAVLNMDAWKVGYNLGILLKPRKGTRIGLAYRSQANMHFRGQADLNHISEVYTSQGAKNTSAKTIVPLARSIMISASQDLTPKLAVLMDVGWQNWGTFKKTTVKFGTGGALNLNRDWNDTYRIGMGLKYRLFKPLLVKGGFSYDSSPASLANRTPDLPVDRNWRYATGFDYDLNKNMVLSLNWEFVDLGPAPIDKSALPITIQPFKRLDKSFTVFNGRQFRGEYNQYINVIGLSFRWKFGKPPEDKTEVKPEPSPASVARVPRG